MICSDREKALAFYHEKLGLPILREHYREKRDDWKIDLEMDGCELELFIMKNCPKRPSYPEAYGLRFGIWRFGCRMWRQRSGSWRQKAFPASRSAWTTTQGKR